jgi:hypothetical protein
VSSQSSSRVRDLSWLSWLIGPAILSAAIIGAWIVFQHPAWLFGVVATAVVGAGMLWILVSTFSPAKADRSCPECGEEALQRLDPATTRGVVCSKCGFRDPERSSFYIAEEEGPLESVALADRARRRSARERR